MAKTPDSKKFMGLLGQYSFIVIFYAKNWRKSRNFSRYLYIVACQRGGVYDEPPWLWTATRHGPGTLSVYKLTDHLKIKNTGQHWTCFTKAE